MRSRAEAVARWVREAHGLKTKDDELLLKSYFSDLTDVSLKAEWRAWIATTLFAQKALKARLLTSTPPCLSFLEAWGFGTRELSLTELRKIWWEKLKPGFTIDPDGLFTDPALSKELLSFVEHLEPLQLPLGGLEHLVEE